MLVPDSVAKRLKAPPPSKPAVKAPIRLKKRQKSAFQILANLSFIKRSSVPMDEDSENEDDESSAPSFFTLEEREAVTTAVSGPFSAGTSATLPAIRANPDAQDPANRPLAFKGRNPQELLEDRGPIPGWPGSVC